MKNTKSRQVIFEYLHNYNEPVSAATIYNELSKKGITLSTIYRTLSTFVNNKIINKMEDNNGTALYYLHEDSHSHYIECTGCHKRQKLDFCPYDDLKQQLKNKNGFTLSDEHILYGICDECNKKSS